MVLNCTQCACSLLVSTWMIASKTVVRKYDNKWVSVGLHAWMNIFWIVNLGLTASLGDIATAVNLDLRALPLNVKVSLDSHIG